MPSNAYPNEETVMSSGTTWAPLTPHDSTNFAFIPKAIAVGAVAGSFVAVGDDDVAGTFYGNAGQMIAIRPKRINATGMTAGMTFVGLKE